MDILVQCEGKRVLVRKSHSINITTILIDVRDILTIRNIQRWLAVVAFWFVRFCNLSDAKLIKLISAKNQLRQGTWRHSRVTQSWPPDSQILTNLFIIKDVFDARNNWIFLTSYLAFLLNLTLSLRRNFLLAYIVYSCKKYIEIIVIIVN